MATAAGAEAVADDDWLGWEARIFSGPLHLAYVLNAISDGFTWAWHFWGR